MVRMMLLLLMLPALAGCSNWFGGKTEKILPGERISVLALQSKLEPDPRLADLAVRLPPPELNRDWPQAGGDPSHAMHHLSANGFLGRLWRVRVGEGSDDDTQLLAQPVVADGRICTMDANAEVRCFDAETGARIWTRELKPRDEDGILGGGIAIDGGRLFATTGFGEVVALDAATGNNIWRRTVPGPVRAAPTVHGGRVFVVTIGNELHTLAADDGRVLWTHAGIPETAGLVGAASPAVAGSVVVVPYSSGEVFALRVENGRVIWTDALTALRRFDPVSSLAHIRGRPVIDRGIVFATSNSRRTVAIDLRTGHRLWERSVGGTQGPWVAGDFVFLLTGNGELICLSRRTGGIRWVRALQRFEDERDKKDPIAWAGPVLASDRLIVVGNNREIWSISPYTGQLLGWVKASGPLLIAPVVANDTVYLLTDEARLLALR